MIGIYEGLDLLRNPIETGLQSLKSQINGRNRETQANRIVDTELSWYLPINLVGFLMIMMIQIEVRAINNTVKACKQLKEALIEDPTNLYEVKQAIEEEAVGASLRGNRRLSCRLHKLWLIAESVVACLY